MIQGVALIRTLAINPDILLLDEPFSALDFDTRLIVSDDIYNIIKKEKKAMIIITHDIEQAISLSDMVIVLSKRPASIKKIFNINISGKNSLERRNDDKFSYYYKEIWEIFDHEI